MALAQQIVDVMIAIRSKRAKLVLIFLAAAASRSLRLDARYDQRLRTCHCPSV